jgi:hypothetical protein
VRGLWDILNIGHSIYGGIMKARDHFQDAGTDETVIKNVKELCYEVVKWI